MRLLGYQSSHDRACCRSGGRPRLLRQLPRSRARLPAGYLDPRGRGRSRMGFEDHRMVVDLVPKDRLGWDRTAAVADHIVLAAARTVAADCTDLVHIEVEFDHGCTLLAAVDHHNPLVVGVGTLARSLELAELRSLAALRKAVARRLLVVDIGVVVDDRRSFVGRIGLADCIGRKGQTS